MPGPLSLCPRSPHLLPFCPCCLLFLSGILVPCDRGHLAAATPRTLREAGDAPTAPKPQTLSSDVWTNPVRMTSGASQWLHLLWCCSWVHVTYTLAWWWAVRGDGRHCFLLLHRCCRRCSSFPLCTCLIAWLVLVQLGSYARRTSSRDRSRSESVDTPDPRRPWEDRDVSMTRRDSSSGESRTRTTTEDDDARSRGREFLSIPTPPTSRGRFMLTCRR